MKRRGDGRAALLAAAREQFELHGYEGTNSNMIARAAGYAPQTFYRHFADKLAIFIAVYKKWTEDELLLLSSISSAEDAAKVLVEHHRLHRVFRRSLRTLTASEQAVGSARAKMRQRQIDLLVTRSDKFARLQSAERLAALLRIERHCDAIADGEFEACGIDEKEAHAALVSELSRIYF